METWKKRKCFPQNKKNTSFKRHLNPNKPQYWNFCLTFSKKKFRKVCCLVGFHLHTESWPNEKVGWISTKNTLLFLYEYLFFHFKYFSIFEFRAQMQLEKIRTWIENVFKQIISLQIVSYAVRNAFIWWWIPIEKLYFDFPYCSLQWK